MTQYDDTNRGQIWMNDKKETEKHPDFKGSINVEGIEYWVSAWKRKPDANPKAPALSFSIQKKEVPEEVRQAAQHSNHGRAAQSNPDRPTDNFDDDIPF